MNAIPVVMQERELEQEGAALVATAEALAVVDDISFAAAGERLLWVKAILKKIADVFDPIDRAQIEARKVTIAQRKGLEALPLKAEAVLKTAMATYEEACARRRREAEAAAQRERERLEAAARAQAEAEARQRRKEEEDRRLAEAVALEASGDAAAAARILDEPIVVAPVAPLPVFVPPVVAPAPRVDGVSFREEWSFEVVDPTLVPREYLVVDEKKLGAVVRAMKGATKIPGVRVFSHKVTAVRTR